MDMRALVNRIQLAFLLTSLPIVAHAAGCDISRMSNGTAPGGATATVNVLNDGRPCGTTLYGVPAERRNPASEGVITLSPKHGKAEFVGPRLQYTPEPGYVGEDVFAAEAWAKGASAAQYLLKVKINVQVRSTS